MTAVTWSPRTRLLALLGDPVAHSLSPRIQRAAFRAAGVDGVYLALRVEAAGVEGLLRGIAGAGGGGNVTLPHKEAAARAVDHLESDARITGAVNTFWMGPRGIHGDNTDVEGVRLAVRELLPSGVAGARVLVLGAGGAARAAVVALAREGAGEIRVRNRTVARAEALVRELRPALAREPGAGPGADPGLAERLSIDPGESLPDPSWEPGLVINATRLGLSDQDPLPLALPPGPGAGVPPGAAVLDLVYRPLETRWIREARSRGHRAADGGTMLVGQGAAAFARWWDRPAPMEAMEESLRRIRAEARVEEDVRAS
jgi:shikimate dehydrogenase